MNSQFHAIFFKKGKVLSKTTRSKKMTLLSKVTHAFLSESIDKVYLKVTYAKDSINEGYYSTLKEFKQAYEAFTEKSLISYIREG